MKEWFTRHREAVIAYTWWLPICVATLVAHSASLQSGFTQDDDRLILHNAYIQHGGSLKGLLTHSLFALTPQPFESSYYRPLSSFSYWLTWHLFGAHTVPLHAVSIAMHLLVAILLAETLCRYGVRRSIAIAVTVLFTVHPVTAENVDYLGGRQDLLGWIIVLAGLMVLPRIVRRIPIAIVTFVAVLFSMFSREFFAASAVLFVVFAAAPKEGQTPIRPRIASAGVGAAMAIGVDLILRHAFHIWRIPFGKLVTAKTFHIMAPSGWRLLKDVFLPTDVASDRSILHGNVLHGILGAIVLMFLLAACVACVRHAPRLRVLAVAGGATVLASIALPLYLVTILLGISNRYAYETLIGFTFVFAALAEQATPWVAQRLRTRSVRAIVGATPFLAALAMAPIARGRAFCYQDMETLSECDALLQPRDPITLHRRIEQSLGMGKLDEAFPNCVAYAAIMPTKRIAVDNCIGSWMLLHGLAADAVPYFQELAYAKPKWHASRRQYFLALALSGHADLALKEIGRWKRKFPHAKDLDGEKANVLAIQSGKPFPLSFVGSEDSLYRSKKHIASD